MSEEQYDDRCPFCGGPSTLFERGREGFYIACFANKCPVKPYTEYYPTEAECFAAWRTRAKPKKPTVVVCAAEKVILKNLQTCRDYLRDLADNNPDCGFNPPFVLNMLREILTSEHPINPEWLKAPLQVRFVGSDLTDNIPPLVERK